MAEMVDIAEHKRAEETIKRLLAELEARQRIIYAMLHTLDLDERLEIALREITALAGADKGAVQLIERGRAIIKKYIGLSERFVAKIGGLPLAQVPWHDKVFCICKDNMEELLGAELSAALQEEGIRSWLSIPIAVERGPLGILIVLSNRIGAFDGDVVRRVLANADTIALILEDARFYRQAQEWLTRLTTLREIDRSISANLSLDGVITVVLEKVLPHIPVDAVGLNLIDPESRRTVLARLQLPKGVRIEGETFALADSLLKQLSESKKLAVIYDVQTDTRIQSYREIIHRYGLRSYVGVPLVIQDQVIGVLHLFTTQPRVFNDEDLDFFQTLAGQVAISVQNARLYEEAVQRYRGMRTLADLTLHLHELSCDEDVATRILEIACQVTGAPMGEYFSYHEEAGSLSLISAVGFPDEIEDRAKRELHFVLGQERGLVGLVAYVRKPLYLPDVQADPRWIGVSSVRSAYWVPLHYEERLFGVYVLLSSYTGGFTKEQLALADMLGRYVSTALENARLFRETQHAYEELKSTQQQLLQAQKMEAVGQLAGGVAHDFNNMLTTIQGYADLTLTSLPEDSPLRENILQILQAAARAASLTRQLLLFSRKHPMNKVPTDLNRQVKELKKMLERLIGEDVTVELDLAEGLWTIEADPGNMDQVITNLAVNARDAMPQGGILTIKTENVVIDEAHCQQYSYARPGRFVCLTVSDTGVGMDEHVLTHLFEPFFTTKGPGKGTGLGLSVVYGIVKSHKGWINVKSRVGQGSVFKIYLPALAYEAESIDSDYTSVQLDHLHGHGERVLLVEDEPAVREITERILIENGYVVYACSTVAEASEVFKRQKGRFDLVLSDVVLPDGNGVELVFQLLEQRPSLAGLLISGYTFSQSEWEYIRQKGLTLLQKPCKIVDLLKHVYQSIKGDR